MRWESNIRINWTENEESKAERSEESKAERSAWPRRKYEVQKNPAIAYFKESVDCVLYYKRYFIVNI